jgi:hypothetical protein
MELVATLRRGSSNPWGDHMKHRVFASAQPARRPATANFHYSTKRILLSVSLLAFAAACGGDRNPTSPTATVVPQAQGPNFDDIPNSLDATVDAAAEAMALTVGGANGTTQLRVETTNDDGKNGCNLTGSTTLVVAVASNNTAVATVSPASVTFTSCGATPTLTVTPVAQGTATISLSLTSNTSSGTFDLAPATFTVNVTAPAPTNTAPSVIVAGVTDGASYNKGSVPAATCQVTDAQDGNSSFAATLSGITGPNAADGIGLQTASCSYTDAGELTGSASATYSIVEASAPTIGYTLNPPSPDGNNGWYKSNVTLTWNVNDPESPNSVVKTGCADQNITADQTATTYSCSATSAGGSASPVSVTIKRDATAPTINGSRSPAANGAGWNNAAVTVSFSCSDALSGVDSCSSPTTLSGQGANQSVTGNATDKAGNTASDVVSGINIDLTAPSISGSRTPSANANGWNNGAVTVSFTCSDPLSGIATCSSPTILSGEGANQSVTGNAADKAENANSATVNGISIDLTAPTVSLVGGPTDGGSYYFGSVPAAPNCSATDGLSGLDGSCSVSGYSAAVGSHTVTATAKDKAGNTNTATATYTVLAWTLTGFYKPVDMLDADGNEITNTVKAGQTVPLKFNVYAGATELITTAAVQRFTALQTACSLTATVDDVEITNTGGTTLRYDTTAGQFVQNWQTPKKAGDCYRVTVFTQDGSTITALFKLK